MNTAPEGSICQQLALAKLSPVEAGFRFDRVRFATKDEYDGDEPALIMSGAAFRVASRGARKGQPCMVLPGSRRSVVITEADFENFAR